MKHLVATAISSALLLTACSEPQTTADTRKTEQTAEVTTAEQANPLFVKSALQYEAPDFSLIKDEHFMPAFNNMICQLSCRGISRSPGPGDSPVRFVGPYGHFGKSES